MRFSYGYADDRSTPLYAEAISVACGVHKDGNLWVWWCAINYGRDRYVRGEGVRNKRDEAIRSAAMYIDDQFGKIPRMATLKIERGREQKMADWLKRHKVTTTYED